MNNLEDRIVEFIRQRRYVTFVELERYFGEFSGEYTWWLDGRCNLLLWSGMSEVFIDTLSALLKRGAVVMRPASLLTYLVDGCILKLPLAKGRYRYRTPHWVPVCFDVPDGEGGHHALEAHHIPERVETE